MGVTKDYSQQPMAKIYGYPCATQAIYTQCKDNVVGVHCQCCTLKFHEGRARLRFQGIKGGEDRPGSKVFKVAGICKGDEK